MADTAEAEEARSAKALPRPLARPADAFAHMRGLVEEAATLVAAPPRTLKGASPLACLAVSIYHEARDQPLAGQQAVAAVIIRRVEAPRWGDTICDVVQPVQFSYLAEDLSFSEISEPVAWSKAVSLAVEVMAYGPAEAAPEADHYHATYVSPTWSRQLSKVARIGNHIFYRVPRLPDAEAPREHRRVDVEPRPASRPET